MARVREVQVHGARRADADGGRTAVNLAAVTASQVRRGNVLVPLPVITSYSIHYTKLYETVRDYGRGLDRDEVRP